MFTIKKITQHYDPEQDRIAQTVQNTEGQVLLLWLTQRLAVRLVGTMASWLDEDVKASASLQSLFTLHAWEQSSAEARLPSDQPVDRAAAQGEALVDTVDLARSPNGYILTFKWRPAGAARLTLMATELRQWLGILHRLFDTAEWPKHVWPDWFTESQKSGTSTTTHRVLH